MQGGNARRPGFILLGLTAFLFACCDRSYAQGTSRMDNRPDVPAAADQSPLGPQTTLTIVRAGNGQGKVTANPVGPFYKKGTPVTLTALPGPYATFEGWSGSCAGVNRTCTITLSGDRTVTAVFSLKTYSIHVRPPVNGVIHPYGTVKAAHGERRRFQIIPLPGYRVSEVLVDKVSKGPVNSYTFKEVAGDHVLEAVFVKQ